MELSSDQTPGHWWKLHLLTWVLIFLVGGSLIVQNLAGQAVMKEYLKGPVLTGYSNGWPIIFGKRGDVDTGFHNDRWLIKISELYAFHSTSPWDHLNIEQSAIQ